MGKAVTLSFRAEAVLADETLFFAQMSGINKSDYIEQALREKNERMLAERMVFLSAKLSQQDLALAEEMDDAVGDGLA